MSINVLNDKAEQPTPPQIKAALGPAWVHFEAMGALTAAFQGEWRHYGKKYPRISLRPALIYAYFTTANDAVNVGFRHAFKLADQKIVQPLASVVFADCYKCRRCGYRRTVCQSCPYNRFH